MVPGLGGNRAMQRRNLSPLRDVRAEILHTQPMNEKNISFLLACVFRLFGPISIISPPVYRLEKVELKINPKGHQENVLVFI